MSTQTILKACMICLISLLTSLDMHAQTGSMPEGNLLTLNYNTRSMMAGYEFYGDIKTKEDGTVVLLAMRQYYGPLYRVTLNDEDLQKFCAIIKEEKMYKYLNYYEPPMEILDGYGWSFYARFSDKKSISSGGTNARPGGDGLNRIHKLMIELVSDEKAELLSEEETTEIIYGR